MLPVTSTVAALGALDLIILSVAVSLRCIKVKQIIGTEDDSGLLRRIGAQGNVIEYVPIALTLLALSGYRGHCTLWLLPSPDH